jgi:hypothetical protein
MMALRKLVAKVDEDGAGLRDAEELEAVRSGLGQAVSAKTQCRTMLATGTAGSRVELRSWLEVSTVREVCV